MKFAWLNKIAGSDAGVYADFMEPFRLGVAQSSVRRNAGWIT